MTYKDLGFGWRIFLDRFKVTMLLVFLLVAGGILSFFQIPREITPTIEIPAATVVTAWPGSNPIDVEKLVTDKIEKEIKNLENVEKYTSISQSGVSIVSVQFDIGTNQDVNVQHLREKIDLVKRDLPDTIPDDPVIQEISISDIPIVSLTLSGDFSWSELKQFSEILEDEFETIGQVKDVSVKGSPEDEIHVFLDPIKLQSYDLGINEVLSAIRSSHRDMPLGSIFVEGQKIELTLQAELEKASEFLDIPIKKVGGALVHVRDVAQVRREFDEFEVETFFQTQDKTYPAVLIDVIKGASKGNVITMVGQVLSRVEDLKHKNRIPKHLQVSVTYDRGDEIRQSLDTLLTSGWQTLVLIGLVMFLALGWRESLLASFSIPLCLLIGITSLHWMGDTFNGISLFALVLSIGLLVDNAIIIVEGLSTGIHEDHLSPHDAALQAIHTFRWPIITGTLTTVFAFMPMLIFISGVSGQYVSVIPKTVITILVGALFVSLWLLPSVSAHFFKRFPPKKRKTGAMLHAVQNWYEEKMKNILSTRGKSLRILLISFSCLIFGFSLVVTRQVLFEVFPGADQAFFTAKVELPVGTGLSETRTLLPALEQSVAPYFEPQEDGEVWLKNVVFTVGKNSDAMTDMDDPMKLPEEHILGVTVNLTDRTERDSKSYDIMPVIIDSLQSALPSHARLEVSEVREGPPTGAPIEIRLMGDEMAHLEEMAEQLQTVLKDQPETRNVRDSRAERTLQVSWQFKRDILAEFGLTPAQVAETLRASVNGVTLVRLIEGGEEIDVDVRIDWEGKTQWKDPSSLDRLETIAIKTPAGPFVTLRQIADPILSSELSRLEHRDGKRFIAVRSDLQKGVPAAKLTPQIEKAMSELELRTGEEVAFGGEKEESMRLIKEMGQSMAFALLLILVVLVWQFNSFYEAIVILLLIPLSLTGVFVGFWLSGLSISFPTMIGIVSLAGIIVNDAIVLIDRINQHVKKGKVSVHAFIEAGKDRLQPIFLTSVTTVVGLLPLSLSEKVWAGLGFAIIFGMMLSTILTLVLVPCFLRLQHK